MRRVWGYFAGRGVWTAMTLAGAMCAAPQAWANNERDLFKGETITINIGYGVGGGYDAYGRVLVRHYGRFIPGQPIVVASNMPGAGGLKAANYIYNTARKDGTQLGIFASSAAMEPLFGNKSAQFDPARFGWIGSMDQGLQFCAVSRRSGITSFDQWLKTKKQLSIGATGPAATTYQHPMVLKNLVGANVKIIGGYPGTQSISLAVERGEVDGMCALFVSSIHAQYQQLIDTGELKLIVQMGPFTTDVFGNIPSVFDYAKSEEDKKVMDLFFGQLLLARPLAAPPGVAPNRLAALRKAFMATMRDKKFLAEAKKTGLTIDPAPSKKVEELLVRFAAYSPAIIEKAKHVMGR